MKALPIAALICLACPAQSVSGPWSGAVHLPGQDLEFQVSLAEGKPMTGTITIPAQGLKDFALSAVTASGDTLSFRMAVPGEPLFSGRLDKEGTLSGTLSQGGQTFPFTLKRAQAVQGPALPAGLRERDVTVGSGTFALPGTLTLPAGKGPFPALVLVHGSGPHDRDESIGASRPFRDLAWGLAQKGIAVLRYEKRTYAHRDACAALPSLTVAEESVADAALAVGLLKGQADLDAGRIFLLGHSLGGYLLPRLAKAAPGCAGYISLAGSARPMEDLIQEQMRAKGLPAETLAQVDAEVARIKALDRAKPASGSLFMAPVAYWLDLQGYAPAREAAAIPRPLFFLQGDKDCQVTLTDFELWKKGLAGRKDVAFQRYPALNHLFMPVEGTSTGAEYARPGQHVDPAVIQDLAAWIGAPRP